MLAMPLSRATALVAVLLIFLLSAGYAAGEREEPARAPSQSLEQR
jgi:hypothetical protein